MNSEFQTVLVTTPEQLAQAKDIRQQVFIEEQRVEPELEWDEWDALTDSCWHWLVLDAEEAPMATARLRLKPHEEGQNGDRIGKVERVAVLRPYRSLGLGRVVMNAIHKFAVEDGFTELVLHAQTHGQGFYEKLGYECLSDDIFYEADIPHVAMRLRIGVKVK